MQIQTIEELIQAIEKNDNYNHQIKGKRLKKQLKSISQTQFEQINFKKFIISDVAILLHGQIDVTIDDHNQLTLILRLDREYPFNPPQIFYQNQQKISQYSYCKDLLPTILKNQMWGPSLTLPVFIQKLPNLASSLYKGQKLNWCYHNQFQYGIEQLKKSGIKLFTIQQYSWQYKVIKLKRVKILGFTPDYILKFQKLLDIETILKLQLWIPIKQIRQVQAKTGKKNYQLQIDYILDQKQQKLYIGGQPNDLENILDNLNPIHMIQRKVKILQKSGVIDYQDAIKCYSTLIQHYSLSNKELCDKYMVAMKKLIQLQYKQEKIKEEKMVEIKT